VVRPTLSGLDVVSAASLRHGVRSLGPTFRALRVDCWLHGDHKEDSLEWYQLPDISMLSRD